MRSPLAKAALACALALAVVVSIATPLRTDAAPSWQQKFQAIVRKAIAAAPSNFAGMRDESSADPNMGIGTEIWRDYKVSPATQAICDVCAMGIRYYDRTVDATSGITTPEHWDFDLSFGLGALDRADVAASVRKFLGPAIPKSFAYAGHVRRNPDARRQPDEIRWNGPNGLMIRVESELTGSGSNERDAVIWIRHT